MILGDKPLISEVVLSQDCYARRRLHTCHVGHGSPTTSAHRRRRCESSMQRRRRVAGEDGSDLSLARGGEGGGLASPSQEKAMERRKEEDPVWLCDPGLRRNIDDNIVGASCSCGE
jgi:hypothetical protein